MTWNQLKWKKRPEDLWEHFLPAWGGKRWQRVAEHANPSFCVRGQTCYTHNENPRIIKRRAHNGQWRQEAAATVLWRSSIVGRTEPKVSLWFSAGTGASLTLDDSPPYVLGRQGGVGLGGGREGVGGEGLVGVGWCAPQGGWDVTEITREHGASVSLQSRSSPLSD